MQKKMKKAIPKVTNKTYAYLRVSTYEQQTEKNKADILKFANDRDFGKVHFIEEKVSGKKSWKERKKSEPDQLQATRKHLMASRYTSAACQIMKNWI